MKKVVLIVGLAATLGFGNSEAADWNWKGDVRERWEYQRTDKTTDITPAVGSNRSRTRMRLGVYPWINDELSAGVQFSTGNDAPNETISRNQNFGSLFQPKSIYLNEEFIDYHPNSYGLGGALNVIAGKRDITNSIIRIDNLVYDSDLTVEGITLQYGKESDGKEKDGLLAIAGYYLLNSWSSTTVTDPVLYLAQCGYKGEINDLSYTVGAGYNRYSSINTLSTSGDKSAIGTGSNGAYPSAPAAALYPNKGYKIVEFFGKIGGQINETRPWKAYTQYAFNSASKSTYSNINDDRRTAWLAGVTIGETSRVGDWAIDAKYDHIENDSVFPLFTDSDRKVGTIVNVEGLEIAATYHLVQNMIIGARYFHYNTIDKSAGEPKLTQLQLDAVVKF
ncbi:MAG: putative porin [Chlorobium sp.]